MKFIPSIIFTLFMTVKQSLLVSFSYQEFDDYDIKKFLNTTEPIWTFNTTAYRRRLCRNKTQHYVNEGCQGGSSVMNSKTNSPPARKVL
ncbi:hypothetical protein MTO96_043115 [Rhipicephalus appendiculatus]